MRENRAVHDGSGVQLAIGRQRDLAPDEPCPFALDYWRPGRSPIDADRWYRKRTGITIFEKECASRLVRAVQLGPVQGQSCEGYTFAGLHHGRNTSLKPVVMGELSEAEA